MAPEIAIEELNNLESGDVVLDPMVGSGTVLHHAARMGFRTLGIDLDPLAVIISRVRTSVIDVDSLRVLFDTVSEQVRTLKLSQIYLPWIDDDKETKEFIKYWFARPQANSLRKIAFVINKYSSSQSTIELDVLKIALSRIIITKKVGASLAWDVSHSRPHKVAETNDFDVLLGFKKSYELISRLISENQVSETSSKIVLGDARTLEVVDSSIDSVITSPPYLNAIDYMRGHKFSLVWLGYSIPRLRLIRSKSIGVEKILNEQLTDVVHQISGVVLADVHLKPKQVGMINRYIKDSVSLMAEIARVLKPNKAATLVVGNSNLNGFNIENSEIFKLAGQRLGFRLTRESVRDIPQNRRYLPVPLNKTSSLSKRMKHEVILTLVKHGPTRKGALLESA